MVQGKMSGIVMLTLLNNVFSNNCYLNSVSSFMGSKKIKKKKLSEVHFPCLPLTSELQVSQINVAGLPRDIMSQTNQAVVLLFQRSKSFLPYKGDTHPLEECLSWFIWKSAFSICTDISVTQWCSRVGEIYMYWVQVVGLILTQGSCTVIFSL